MADKARQNNRFMRNIQPKLNLNSQTQKQSLNIVKTKNTGRIGGINPLPNEITSASAGFSLGMKKQLESMEDYEVSDKRQCLITHNNILRNNSILEFEKKHSKTTRSVSSVSDLTPLTKQQGSTSIIQCSENWKQMQQSIRLEEKQHKKRIEMFVKHYLFKNLKFIPSYEMMIYTKNKQSLNYLVCKKLNICPEQHETFWLKYSKFVETALNAARNDAVQAVKKSFLKGNKILKCNSILQQI